MVEKFLILFTAVGTGTYLLRGSIVGLEFEITLSRHLRLKITRRIYTPVLLYLGPPPPLPGVPYGQDQYQQQQQYYAYMQQQQQVIQYLGTYLGTGTFNRQ